MAAEGPGWRDSLVRMGGLGRMGSLVVLAALFAASLTGCGACQESTPAGSASGAATRAATDPTEGPTRWPPPPDDSDLPTLSDRSDTGTGAPGSPGAGLRESAAGGPAAARPRPSRPDASTRLWAQLTDPDPEVREHVLERLSGRKDPKALETLEEYLIRESDPDLKARALELLEEAGPRAASAIGRALSDPSPAVREQAAEALESVGGPESVALLWAAHARESDPDVAETILDALEVLGEDVDAYRMP